MLGDEPFAPATTMPAAMTENERKKIRNRDDASERPEFAIMERVKEHSFYPKPQETVNPFAQPRAAHTSRVMAMTSSLPPTLSWVPENRTGWKPLSPFLRDAAAADAKQRPGLDACATNQLRAAGLGGGVGRCLGVKCGLAVGVGLGVGVALPDAVAVTVAVGVAVAVADAVEVGVTVAVGVGVALPIGVAVAVGVDVGVEIAVAVAVAVAVGVGVGVAAPPGTLNL